MKIYLITQNEQNGYDTYDSAVVCAENEEEARGIHPGPWVENGEPWPQYYYRTWASNPDVVVVKYLGEAIEGMEKGVVVASFNAG